MVRTASPGPPGNAPNHADATFVTAADLTLAALSFASGSADVFAFLEFHDVFTSAMTGNTALFGLALGHGDLLAAGRSLAALIGFCLGSIAGTILNDAGAAAPQSTRLRRLIGVEIGFLAAVLVVWAIVPHPVYGPPLYALIMAGALAMGMQSVAAREIDLPGINTVVVTNTLTLVMMAIGGVLRLSARERRLRLDPFRPITLRQVATLAVYVCGAGLSGFLAVFRSSAIAIPALLAALAAFAIAGRFRRNPNTPFPATAP